MFLVACQSQSANRQVNDAQLSAAVKSKLTSDTRLASLTDVDVKAKNGKVSLDGEVESEEVKRLAEETARGVSGVAQVVITWK